MTQPFMQTYNNSCLYLEYTPFMVKGEIGDMISKLILTSLSLKVYVAMANGKVT